MGLSGPRLSPRAGGSVPGVSGAARSPSSGPSGGNPRGSSGPPARRSHAPLPAPAAGGGFAGFPAEPPFFSACPPFSAACPPFSPASPPRFPVHLLFCPQSRLQAFYPLHGVFCTLRRRRGCPARPWWPAEAVSLWVLTTPALRPAPPSFPLFLPPIHKGKKILIPLYKRSRVEREREGERERERERERDVVLYIGGVIF